MIETATDAPMRGEVWRVNFNSPLVSTPRSRVSRSNLPTTGDEIFKQRPAVVLSINADWNLDLRIVAPLTRWQDRFATANLFWMLPITKDSANGLQVDSAANCFQAKSVSLKRFEHKLGSLEHEQLLLIAQTVAFCIGLPSTEVRR